MGSDEGGRDQPEPLQASSGAPEPASTLDSDGAASALEKPHVDANGGTKPVCIVGIGAGHGGVTAFARMLEGFPDRTGMAFVLITHLKPDEHGRLGELLGNATNMPVHEVRQQRTVEANQIYVVPSNATMLLADGRLDFGPRLPRGVHMPIDAFFRSLAIDQGSRSIGVVLSGEGSDGTLGLATIKAEGGICIAQAPETALLESMPQSAIGGGFVDLVRPVDEIAREIALLGQRIRTAYPEAPDPEEAPFEQEDDLKKILALVRATQNVDFTLYRPSTIKRRIIRRMVLNRIQSVRDYITHLSDHASEVEALYHDILIKVTQFFRDPEVFDTLKDQIYPSFLKSRNGDGSIRIWVPGCSTGEEAYSIAISLLEVLSERRVRIPIQIFATDVSEAALDRARAGVYIENIAVDVSPERLRRFFTKTGKHYQISRSIRDMCIFAKQNVFRDPPFSRLDLISCRNVLIYFEPVLQKKILPMFHYALKPTGFLVLGTSETVGGLSDLFPVFEKKNKIHAKASVIARPFFELTGGRHGLDHESAETMMPKSNDGPSRRVDVLKEADRFIMSRYAPAGVIINADLHIVQFRGHTGPFLEPSPGEASLHILKMAPEGILFDLRTAIHKSKKTDEPVRADGLRLRDGEHFREVSIEVIPLRDGQQSDTIAPAERCFLVLFEEKPSRATDGAASKPGAREKARPTAKSTRDHQIVKLEQELLATKEYLRAIIEEQEATNEDLQSYNEELLSSNEELQSINEELETAKEELQSTNEELTTVNEELERRTMELAQFAEDLGNLLASVNIPIVMLDSDLRIRRFTPQAERVLKVIPGDLGRPIGDIKQKVNVPDLEQLIGEVIERASIYERDVQDHEGRWYSLRIQPYRTTKNRIDGAVLCLIDIDNLKRSSNGNGHPPSATETRG